MTSIQPIHARTVHTAPEASFEPRRGVGNLSAPRYVDKSGELPGVPCILQGLGPDGN